MVKAVDGLARKVNPPDLRVVGQGGLRDREKKIELRLVSRPKNSHRKIINSASNKLKTLDDIALMEKREIGDASVADVLTDKETDPSLRYKAANIILKDGLLERSAGDSVIVNKRRLSAVTETLVESGEYFRCIQCATSLQKALANARISPHLGNKPVRKCDEISKHTVGELTESVRKIFEARWNDSTQSGAVFRSQIVNLLFKADSNDVRQALKEVAAKDVWEKLFNRRPSNASVAFTTIVGQSVYASSEENIDHIEGYRRLSGGKERVNIDNTQIDKDQPGF